MNHSNKKIATIKPKFASKVLRLCLRTYKLKEKENIINKRYHDYNKQAHSLTQ